MHGHDGTEATQNALSEPLHIAIAGRDVPDYDIIELLIDAGLNLECKVFYVLFTVFSCAHWAMPLSVISGNTPTHYRYIMLHLHAGALQYPELQTHNFTVTLSPLRKGQYTKMKCTISIKHTVKTSA